MIPGPGITSSILTGNIFTQDVKVFQSLNREIKIISSKPYENIKSHHFNLCKEFGSYVENIVLIPYMTLDEISKAIHPM